MLHSNRAIGCRHTSDAAHSRLTIFKERICCCLRTSIKRRVCYRAGHATLCYLVSKQTSCGVPYLLTSRTSKHDTACTLYQASASSSASTQLNLLSHQLLALINLCANTLRSYCLCKVNCSRHSVRLLFIAVKDEASVADHARRL
jgi:hypothetical protein